MKRIFIATFAAFSILVFWPGEASTEARWKYEDCGGFKDYGERQEFMRPLKKHGLNQRFSVIHDWPDAPYYYRPADGVKCAFR